MKKIAFILLFFGLVLLAACNNGNAKEYKSELQDVSDKMFENATKAESILDKYADVWSYSINSNGAIPVAEMSALTGFEQDVIEEYFEINAAGNIPNDFSTNIHSLNSYYEKSGDLEKIEEVSDEVKSKITDLNKPPEDYEKVYDEVLDMYNYSEEYIEMALSPSGSLQEFNEAKNQLSSDISSKYKRIEVIMPNEE